VFSQHYYQTTMSDAFVGMEDNHHEVIHRPAAECRAEMAMTGQIIGIRTDTTIADRDVQRTSAIPRPLSTLFRSKARMAPLSISIFFQFGCRESVFGAAAGACSKVASPACFCGSLGLCISI
jgi:hypothetical protein